MRTSLIARSAAMLAGFALALTACGGGSDPLSSGSGQTSGAAAASDTIVVGSANFTESQILSFFGTALTLAALYAVGFLTVIESLQGWPGDAISFISLSTRFDSFARGVLDTRAVIYFLSITIFSLLVAFRSLESRKWA